MTSPTEKKRIAACPTCRTPLVWTFKFRRAEWYCATCRAPLAMFEALSLPWQAEIAAHADQLRDAFHLVAKDCIAVGERRRDCEACQSGRGDHQTHASAEELERSVQAYFQLVGRTEVMP